MPFSANDHFAECLQMSPSAIEISSDHHEFDVTPSRAHPRCVLSGTWHADCNSHSLLLTLIKSAACSAAGCTEFRRDQRRKHHYWSSGVASPMIPHGKYSVRCVCERAREGVMFLNTGVAEIKFCTFILFLFVAFFFLSFRAFGSFS